MSLISIIMVMNHKRQISPVATTSDQEEYQSSSENGPDSPLSGDDLRATASAPGHLSVKKKRSIKKKVVLVKVGEMEGSRNKGEAYPPSDSWARRKYGQKPIKGSPYPRGYYRCSSFKGCPARKQVERNRTDPTTLIITYAYEHNHPLPTSKHHLQHQAEAADTPAPSTPSAATTTTTTDIASDELTNYGNDQPSSSPSDQVNPFGDSTHHLEFVGDSSILLESLGLVEYSWVSTHMSFETAPSLVGPTTTCDNAEVAAAAYSMTMREEDEFLFGDLGELPEGSIVFRKSNGDHNRRCTTTTLCGTNG